MCKPIKHIHTHTNSHNHILSLYPFTKNECIIIAYIIPNGHMCSMHWQHAATKQNMTMMFKTSRLLNYFKWSKRDYLWLFVIFSITYPIHYNIAQVDAHIHTYIHVSSSKFYINMQCNGYCTTLDTRTCISCAHENNVCFFFFACVVQSTRAHIMPLTQLLYLSSRHENGTVMLCLKISKSLVLYRALL